ncbi:MAG: hypothetical protein GVY28_08295 [Alphaproteobacteria bacterium]|nr:hypothetical protein [Alphaproteobacteria bacterium]
MRRHVDDHQVAPAVRALPQQREDGQIAVILRPGGGRVQKLPVALADGRGGDGAQQVLEEGTLVLVRLLLEPAAEMHRMLAAPRLHLAVMDHPHAGQRRQQHRRGMAIAAVGQGGGGARLVVVLQELQRPGHGAALDQLMAQAGRVVMDDRVVDALVVGEIEAEQPQPLLQPPIGFGDEAEAGMQRPYRVDRIGPEFALRVAVGKAAPGALEDVGQHQHGHVAAHSVALVGDRLQRVDHAAAGGGATIVQLHGVAPAGEIGIAAEGEDPAVAGLQEILRMGFEIALAAGDITVGVLADPGMIRGGVVGVGQPAAQAGQRLRPAEFRRHGIIGHGIGRAGHVLRRPVGQRGGVMGREGRVGGGGLPPRRTRGPHAHHPDGGDAEPRPLGDALLRHVGQGGRVAAERRGGLLQELPGVDFEQQGVRADGVAVRQNEGLSERVGEDGDGCDGAGSTRPDVASLPRWRRLVSRQSVSG